MWTRAVLLIHGVLAMIFATAPACEAGGGWPRGTDRVFASVSYSTFGDMQGYVTGLTYKIPGVEPVELTEELGFFVELGLSETLTFGLDRNSRPKQETQSSVFFLRKNYSRPNWRSSYGIEIGLGGYRDWRQINDTQLRLGLAWGRGFETRWFDGWAEVDAKVATLEKTESVYWKVDSTLGFKPTERSTFFLQMQSGAMDDFDIYTRAVPTYVMRINRHISLESADTVGVRNDDAQGIKVGAWLEF
ncbi:hypothetical protein [Aliiruegeria lutimaris]|uniref:Uncharacterized protein n=1 Tax=Aliiruegeria lutimaris TaxID=571298 RepID=A0A1G8Y8W4_9RHOB|nr:hypothetical protein [Aliiruegeria lutimaris]SDJ99117.1 hypothetical protein SAMN04488026_102848 [Aliiruegeria lutimaris]